MSAVDTAIDTMARLADELAGIELSACIQPPPLETLNEISLRRSQAVRRLGDARLTLLVVRDLLKQEAR